MIDPDKNSTKQTGNVGFLDLDELGFPTSDENSNYTNALVNNNKVIFSPVIGTNSERGLKKIKINLAMILQLMDKSENYHQVIQR